MAECARRGLSSVRYFRLVLVLASILLFAMPSQAQVITFGRGGIGIGISSGGRYRGSPYRGGSYRGGSYRGYNSYRRGGYSPYYRRPYNYGGRSFGWGIELDLSRSRRYYDDETVEPQQAPRQTSPLPSPPLPTAKELELLTSQELVKLIQIGANRLHSELMAIEQGQGWIEFLSLVEVRQRSKEYKATNRKWLLSVVSEYNKTKENPKFAVISEMWGFQVTHLSLVEYSKSNDGRLRRQLQVACDWLEDSLKQIGADKQGWFEFLEIREMKKWLAAKPLNGSVEQKTSARYLKTLLQVAKDSRYKMISDLPAYKKLTSLLQSYGSPGNQLPKPPSVSAPPAPDVLPPKTPRP